MVCSPKVRDSCSSFGELPVLNVQQLRDDGRGSLRGPAMAFAERQETPAVRCLRLDSLLEIRPGSLPICSIPLHVSGDLVHVTARMTHARRTTDTRPHVFSRCLSTR